MSMLSTRMTGVNPILAGIKDPFLYNPRKSLSAQVMMVLHHTQLIAESGLGENIGSSKRDARASDNPAKSFCI